MVYWRPKPFKDACTPEEAVKRSWDRTHGEKYNPDARALAKLLGPERMRKLWEEWEEEQKKKPPVEDRKSEWYP